MSSVGPTLRLRGLEGYGAVVGEGAGDLDEDPDGFMVTPRPEATTEELAARGSWLDSQLTMGELHQPFDPTAIGWTAQPSSGVPSPPAPEPVQVEQ